MKDPTINKSHRVLSGTMLILVAVFSVGCTTIPVEPFEAFSTSLVELNQGTEKAVAGLVPLSEKRFKRELIEQLEAGESDHLESLSIDVETNDPFALNLSPLFFKTQQFGLGASQVTSAMVSYSQLLLKLADPQLLPQDKFEQLATDLNANAYQALSTMDTNPGKQVEKNTALFSNAAIAATKAYLAAKQKKNLIEILTSNQSTVDSFAVQMQAAVRIMALAYKQEYQESYQQLQRKVVAPSTRKKAVDDLIALDRIHIEQLTMLRALYSAYGKIPAAHNSLEEALKNPNSGLESILAVLDSGKRLKAGYDQALLANKKSSIQAKADTASAQADAAESSAEAASLRATIANTQAVSARNDADSAPQDVEKKNLAKSLEETAKTLSEEAEKKRTQAKSLREAANAVQQSTDDIKKRLSGAL